MIKKMAFLSTAIFMFAAKITYAAPVPAAGSKFYTVYDVIVNDIVQGPPGVSLAVGGIAYGGMQLFKNAVLAAIGTAVGSVLMLMSPTIAGGLGALIP